MISLRRSLNEFENLQELSADLGRAYQSALASVREHWVAVDAATTRDFRRSLSALGEDLDRPSGEAFYQQHAGRLNSVLREYGRMASAYVRHLSEELSNTSQALEEIVSSVGSQSGRHEENIKENLQRLENASRANDLDTLRGEVRAAVESFRRQVEEMRKESEFTVAMLRDEIRSLQRRLEPKPAAFPFASTLTISPREFEETLDRAIGGGDPLCLAVFAAPALEYMHEHGNREGAMRSAAEFLRRLTQALPPGTPSIQHRPGGFLAILSAGKADAIQVLKDATPKLIAPLPGIAEGRLRNGTDVRTGILNHRHPEKAAELMRRAVALMQALAAA